MGSDSTRTVTSISLAAGSIFLVLNVDDQIFDSALQKLRHS